MCAVIAVGIWFFAGSCSRSDRTPDVPIAGDDAWPPTVPTNLAAQAISSSNANLTWTASSDNVGVAGYRVFRDDAEVGTSLTTSYRDSGLSPSTTYSYTVSAYDAKGNESNRSDPAGATTYPVLSGDVITVDSITTYQAITGWEATAWAGQDGVEAFPNYRDELYNQAVNDLGINRVRLEVRSGVENDQDYWTMHQTAAIDYDTWRSVRYSTIDDNGDPDVIDWNGFHFSELDNTVDEVVLPLKTLVEANGEKLYINLNYVAFTDQIGAGLDYHHDNPQEYAEFVLAVYQHLQSKYGWVPDACEVILEPDNVSQWDGTLIGQAIVATAGRLQAAGFTPRFIAPSNTNMANAITYFDQMVQVAGAVQFLLEFSYHRYGGVSDTNLQTIADRASQNGVNTAHLEWIGATYNELHKDLKIGMNSAWAQYTLGGPGSDDGGKYYCIDDTDPDNPVVSIGSRTKFLRQYFKFIRPGALRIEAATNDNDFDPVAFVNINGKYVVVVKTAAGGPFYIQGLPAGNYGIKYTTSSEYDIDLSDATVGAGEAVSTSIPEAGVITIYAK
jgi:hypothetical protein